MFLGLRESRSDGAIRGIMERTSVKSQKVSCLQEKLFDICIIHAENIYGGSPYGI